MRVAILADTHMPRGRRRLPGRCLEALGESDLILHLGDFTELSVLEELASIGPPLEAVHGNVDSAELRRMLPARRIVELEGVRVGMTHDAGPARGRLLRLRSRFPQTAAVLFAHSHLPLRESAGGFQIFNPGSPTERRRAPARSMGFADVAADRISFRHLDLG